MPRIPGKYVVVLIYAALVLTTLAVFAVVYENEFISFDDDLYITANRMVQAGLTWKGVKWAFTTTHAYNWHPLTWLSHMLDCELFGLNAGAHHLTNVLFHIVNALLLFGILRRMTGAIWPSAFVAALFALHPVHVESVAWASERKDVLSSLFWMLTIGFHVRYVRRPRFITYLATILAFAVGLLAKQMLVTLPFVLLLLDYWPLRRLAFKAGHDGEAGPAANAVSARQCILEKLPLFILSVIAAATVYFVQQRTIVARSFGEYPLLYRIENALVAYVAYIGKMFLPARLAIFYPHLFQNLMAWQSVGSAMLLVCVTVVVLAKLRRSPYLAVGWFWYLGTLLPVIGLIQVGSQSMADRYTYLPSIGIFIMVAWHCAGISPSWRRRKVALAVSAGLVLAVLSVCTRLQLGHWRNNITLYKHAVTVVPDNSWAYSHLGHAWLEQRQQPVEAAKHFTEALRIVPNFPEAHSNLALALMQQGKLEDAIKHWSRAIELNPRYYRAHNNLGLALQQLGRTAQATEHFKLALEIKPDQAETHLNLGHAMVKLSDLEGAFKHYMEGLRINPQLVDARTYSNLGALLLRQGQLDEAVQHCTEALRIQPDNAEAHYNLARVRLEKGQLDDAVTHFYEALRLKPFYTAHVNNLAWILATHKDTKYYNPEGAVRLAERVCDLTKYENPSFLDTLAAAYAADGRFQLAVQTAEKALQLAQTLPAKQPIEDIQNHLALYRAGQPYVEPSQDPSSQ
ncbi:MAG: tetratricopeptide repeat protein [Planctomycetota bacterium]|jgi:tetratricopeptide (TPR) repeat protein